MKPILLFCFFVLLCSCSKDEDNIQPKDEITTTTYEVGKEYTRKFYFYNHAISWSEEYGIFAVCYFVSECGRLDFQLNDYEKDTPSNAFRSEVINLEKGNRNKIGQLDYFLVADFKFVYGSGLPVKASEWKIVIGSFEEYILDNQIYKRLVIK